MYATRKLYYVNLMCAFILDRFIKFMIIRQKNKKSERKNMLVQQKRTRYFISSSNNIEKTNEKKIQAH